MTNRFQYYTGYEVDVESSDDEDDVSCNSVIAHGHLHSDSSDDEFDRPLRDYIEKTAFQETKTKNSSSTFANEMEDELDKIYHNFISHGAFELPISTQTTREEKQSVTNKQDDDDTDDENYGQNSSLTGQDNQEKTNDDLLYDPDEEEEDEKWMTNQRLKSRGMTNAQQIDPSSLGPTDAVLNCPACMILVCHDCQRHETNRNQYRAMFVFNCTIDENRIAPVSMAKRQKSFKQKKRNRNKRLKTDDHDLLDNVEEQDINNDILRPVLCSECRTELGVYEPKEELYHFVNVLASH